MLTFTMWPKAADQTEIICEWHFHPDEIGKPGFNPQDAVEFWDITNKQDWQLSDLAQQGIGSKGYQPGPYSNREELLLALDRFVLERTGKDRKTTRDAKQHKLLPEATVCVASRPLWFNGLCQTVPVRTGPGQ